MERYDYDAIVIGAGLGGIACAGILAKNGMKTIIFENADIVGGCCSTFEDHGYKFDTGASVVEFVETYHAVFERLGRKTADYIDFIPCDPLYSFRTYDGEYIEIPKDVDAMGKVIEKYSKRDAKNWFKYAKFWQEMKVKGMNKYLHADMQSWKSLWNMFAADLSMMKFMPAFMTTYEFCIKRWFSHPRVMETMGFQSYWVGLPPRLCPGIYAAITYTEHDGIYYPKGGMGAIPEGLMKVAKEHGAQLKLKTQVTKVLIKNGRACGVELKDGTKLSAKLVVANVNAKKLYLEMIGEEYLTKVVAKGCKSYKLSIPMPMVYLGIKGKVPLKAHHTLPLGRFESYNKTWDDFLTKGKFLDEPLCLISWPSETDPSLAPKGQHVLNIGVGGPYKLAEGNWDTRREEFLEKTIDLVHNTVWPGIRDQIVYKNISTPFDFERRLLSPEGAVYALQNDIASTMVFRPSNKSKSIKGLYLVGASTHPGGGTPMVTASGGITADLILADWKDLK